jgi:hypothetical protein
VQTTDQGHLPSRVFGTHQRMLVRRFSNPIVRRLAVNVVHSHIFLDSFFDQASRCVQDEIIPLAFFHSPVALPALSCKRRPFRQRFH